MDTIDRAELTGLIDQTGGLCASIFMPTHRGGPEIRQDPIRLKNLLKQAEGRLNGAPDGKATREALDPVRRLLDDAAFWQHQGDGLAVFAAPGLFRTYRLPESFSELVVVNRRPHVKPLLPLLHRSRPFCVLALSQNGTRLLRCTHLRVEPIDLPGDVPASLDELLSVEVPERGLQFHTQTPVRPGQRSAVFHGHGAGGDDAPRKRKIAEFLNLVARGVQRRLNGQAPGTPLVLAATDFVASAFREASDYAPILPEIIAGSPEALDDETLRDRAWRLVQPGLDRELTEAADQCRHALGTDRGADKVSKVVASAYQGRVELLIVALDRQHWGRYDVVKNHVVSHPQRQADDDDLLDFAAIHTLIHGGRVHAVPQARVPSESPVAAVLRP